MLRTQRSVEASFSHVNYTAIDMVAAASEKAREAEGDSEQLGETVGIKRKFVAAGDNEVEAATAKKGRPERAGDDQEGEGEVVERTVPKQVYGEMAMSYSLILFLFVVYTLYNVTIIDTFLFPSLSPLSLLKVS